MKKWLSIIICVIVLPACSVEQTEYVYSPIKESKITLEQKQLPELDFVKEIDLDIFTRQPKEWGENVMGVKTSFQTDEKEIALTFDACGGMTGSLVDDVLIDFLRQQNIPATLFINERWIRDNESLFIALANDPLFQIENHGSEHLPLSVSGGEAWGIPATSSPAEAQEEIMANHKTVKDITGEDMSLFRSGTAFYDEVAVELANQLGYEVVNFDILGDAGATFSSNQVKNALLSAKPGSIALLHMNQPNSGTADGVISAIPRLKEQGYEFVLLKDKHLE